MNDLWAIGDVPVGAIEITPDIDTAGYTGAEANLIDPAGVATPMPATLEPLTPGVPADGAVIVVQWPAGFSFARAGLYRVAAVLTGPGPARRRAANEPVIVEDHDAGWHTVESARDEHGDLARLDELRLFDLLESARSDCLNFATSAQRRAPRPVPSPWRQAQLMQVRERFDAALAAGGADDEIGGQGMAIPWRPLERKVKQLLRPTTRNPRSIR